MDGFIFSSNSFGTNMIIDVFRIFSSSPEFVALMLQYSDLPEADRARVLEDFRQATMRWNKLGREEADEDAEKEEQRKSHVLVVTDACLPVLGSVELPVSSCILINYELPTKKVHFF